MSADVYVMTMTSHTRLTVVRLLKPGGHGRVYYIHPWSIVSRPTPLGLSRMKGGHRVQCRPTTIRRCGLSYNIGLRLFIGRVWTVNRLKCETALHNYRPIQMMCVISCRLKYCTSKAVSLPPFNKLIVTRPGVLPDILDCHGNPQGWARAGGTPHLECCVCFRASDK